MTRCAAPGGAAEQTQLQYNRQRRRVSKDPEARWIEHPHVFIRCESPGTMIAQSYRVVDVLTGVGVRWDGAANVEPHGRPWTA